MRLTTLIIAVVLLSVTLSAYSYLKLEQITVAGTATGFTAANISGAAHVQPTTAICTGRTAEMSYTIDGTTPTATVGMLWEPGETKQFNGNDVLQNFRAIRTGSTSGQLDCVYSAP